MELQLIEYGVPKASVPLQIVYYHVWQILLVDSLDSISNLSGV